MSSSNLNKKRARPTEPLTITLGRLHNSYYYISDSLSGGGTKIKISMVDLSNPHQEKQISLKEHEEENDTSQDILNLSTQVLKEEFPKIVNNIKSNETEQIYLPISSSWFNMDNIHEIEIKSLPEFFCGKYPSKTPQVYKNYRNFIINLYRENSTMYLSSNTCRKHLAGDTCEIMRIHSFLEHWGIINFKLHQKFKPVFIPKAFNFKSPIYIDTNLFMLENSKNVDNITDYNKPESSIILTKDKKNIATLYPINKISNKIFNELIDNLKNVNKYIEENPKADLKKYEKINFLLKNYRPKCDICGNFCTMHWYSTKDQKNNDEEKEDIDSSNDINVSINIDEKSLNKEFNLICQDCYSNNDIPLPNNLKRENFEISSIYNLFSKEKLNEKIINKLNNEKWTEEEDNKLLEGLKNNKNWEEIIQSLGNENIKTKKDCIFHLLQMPIQNMIDSDNKNENDELSKDESENYGEQENVEEKPKENNINENDENVEMKVEESININNNNNEEGNENLNNNKDNELNNNEDNELKKGVDEKMNNNMIDIFIRLFRRYLNEKNNKKSEDESGNIQNQSFKEIIYKTFAKSINKCRDLKNEEKNEMKNIVDILVYLEMKKIELKMNYFKQFERVLEYKKNQLKTIETQIIQERIKLITKKLLLQKMQQQENEMKLNNI